ncbi:MAG TPA: ChbG/HpnK family deacetylase [Acidimicrobiales bacterium]
MTTATEALGLDPQAAVVILTCDELGFSYGVNSAIYAALRMHQATSASVMVPAPWARAAAAHYNGEDVGVHLTLNSELDQYRWGPITQSPSLLDGDGAFPRTIDDIWEHADTEEVRREWQAQIERAQLWGFAIGHLDAHLSGVELKPEFFDVYLDLAEKYRLPIRLPGAADERRIGFPFRALATERGVLAPDRVIALGTLGDDEATLREALSSLEPGVTELHVHPAHDSPELRAATPSWETRVNEVTLLEIAAKILDEGGPSAPQRIGYGVMTQAMRREK